MYLIIDRETGEVIASFITKNDWCMNIIAQRLNEKAVKI